MKYLTKLKISLLLVINAYFICKWLQEFASTNTVGKQWSNIIIPLVMLGSSFVVLLIFKIVEIFNNKYRNVK